MLTPKALQELGRFLRLHERGITTDREVALRLARLAYPDKLDAVLAEIPPALVETVKAEFSDVAFQNSEASSARFITLSSLPPITRVEAVSLRDINPNGVDSMRQARETLGVTLADESADRVVSLWKQLPPGYQARCHTPPYGLRFFSEGELVLQASICWKCKNIFGELPGEDCHYEFDAEAEVSTRLFALIRQSLDDDSDLS